MVIQKGYDKTEPGVKQLVAITPELLGEWKTRLELKGKSVLPGQVVTLDITNGLSLVWDPEIPTARFFDNAQLEAPASVQ